MRLGARSSRLFKGVDAFGEMPKSAGERVRSPDKNALPEWQHSLFLLTRGDGTALAKCKNWDASFAACATFYFLLD